MQRTFVTGVGVVSSLGMGRQKFFTSLLEGKTAEHAVTRFDTSRLERHIACEVRNFEPRDFLSHDEIARTGWCTRMALAAVRMAIEDSGLPLAPSHRKSVVIGTTMGEANLLGELQTDWIMNRAPLDGRKVERYGTGLLGAHVARATGARGFVHVLPAACAAGNYAIACGSDLIRTGRADVVIVGASEVIADLQFAGFCRLGAIAPEKCQPFDKNRKGLLVGEGAAIFVLESEEHVHARGAAPLAEVGGAGIACDAHHITRPLEDGAGNRRTMLDAIRMSGLSPDDVDYVNAHGTATHANDETETRVLKSVFGARELPISSIKSSIGHCMGAASALEAAVCIEAILRREYPPTMHFETPDPECDVHLVANRPRKGKADVVLNNSLAFGGYDATVCFARPGVLPAVAARGTDQSHA